LSETLLPLIDSDNDRAISRALEVINRFPEQYEHRWLVGMRAKLGLFCEDAGDFALVEGFLMAMQGHHIDWTLAFRYLADAAAGQEEKLRALFSDVPTFEMWHQQWQLRLTQESVASSERAQAMRRVSPAFIPRNHRVEEALSAAVERGDYKPFDRLLKILSRPFDDQPESAAYAEPAPEGFGHYRTFCGT
jgi:uncharacterized protein YdiU (UPF0061 family)